jgi:hypothetical protein
MPVPACAAYVVVGWYCSQLLIEQQSEDIGGRERIAMPNPSIAPPPTAMHRALSFGTRHVDVANKGQQLRLATAAAG